jgi:hypothetical protein
MRPLISVLSAIGRFCAVMTPTAGGAPGPACPFAGEVSKSGKPNNTMLRRVGTIIRTSLSIGTE